MNFQYIQCFLENRIDNGIFFYSSNKFITFNVNLIATNNMIKFKYENYD